MPLPIGQYDLGSMPRFGLPPFAARLPADLDETTIAISGEVAEPGPLDLSASAVPQREQVSDFHCVTTWSCTGIRWQGWAFSDVWHQQIVPQMQPTKNAAFVIFIGRDGYAACLALADLLADDIMIAHTMNGKSLGAANGGAFRLVAPAHYGYKSVKHLRAIKVVKTMDSFHAPGLKFLVHPRGRVAFEERGVGVPQWILRRVYRVFVRPNIWLFRRALRSSEN